MLVNDLVVKVMVASTIESSLKLQRNATSKSRDLNYYSTFCNMKKSAKSQQRAESGDRKTNNSSKLSTKIQLLINNTSSHKEQIETNTSKDTTLKSIKKVLIKNINLQNKLNSTALQKLGEGNAKMKRESSSKLKVGALAQKIPVTCSKSPMNQVKDKSHRLVKDKNALSTKCVKAEANSEYFVIKSNKKELDSTPSLKCKGKRNEIAIVKSTSNLKDISVGYILS